MALEKIRNSVGSTERRKRHPNTEGVDDPDEAIEPDQWRDPESPTLRERASRRWKSVVALGFIAAVLVGVLSIYAGRFVIGTLTNPVVQSTLKDGALIGFGVVIGVRYIFNRLEKVDELVLFTGEGIKRYKGRIDTDSAGNLVFEPFRGWTPLLKRPRELTLGDLGGDLDRAASKAGRDEDDPVRIRLDDAITGVHATDMGSVAASLTSGLRIDKYGKESDLYTAPPDLADTERYDNLADQLEYYVEKEIPSLEDDIEDLEDKIAEIRERVREDRDKAIDQFIGRVVDLEESRSSRPSAREERRRQRPMIGGPNSENGSGDK